MKKIVPVAALALVAAFTSCKKDYSCTCTTTMDGVVMATQKFEINETKKKAKSACSGKVTQSSMGMSATMECKLD